MGIDGLNKAAVAAGYAMATPDDDTDTAPNKVAVGEEAGRAVILLTHDPRGATWSVASAVNWAKSLVPSIGGRAPA